MEKQNKLIFLGILIILAGLVINAVGKLLTLIAVIIGGFFVVKGMVQLNKTKKKK